MIVNIATIKRALEQAWCKETSFLPDDWSSDNPARGQCVVTALIVQDYLGGDIIRYEVIGAGIQEKDYANVLSDGNVIELTESQYPKDITKILAPVNLKGFPSIREKRLAEANTRKRYELLLDRVKSYLE